MVSRSPPTKHGWTDNLCLEEGRKHCQWKEIPANEMEGHLISFVNLWLSPDDREDSEICSIVRNVLLMFPLGLSNELLLRDVFDAGKDTAQAPPAIDDKEIVIIDPVTEQLEYKEKCKVRALHSWLKQKFAILKLAAENASTKYVQASQKLRTVVGFCALILMRLITKNEVQIKRCFPYGASKVFDLLFPEVGLNVPLVPPSPRTLELAKYALTNNGYSDESVGIFHLLVFQYLKSTGKDDASSRFTKQILEEGCLNVLEGNGMGLVTLFQDVKHMFSNIEERRLLSMISGNDRFNEDSKRLLISFLEIYTRQDNPQHSWKWVRVLHQDYFSDLNIRDNRWLCCRFAALLLDELPHIFGHKELRFGSIYANNAITWAEPSKKVLKRLNDDSQPK